MSDDGSDKLLKLKGEVSATGASGELEIGSGLPAALAMVFPGWAAKRQAKLVATGQILQKMRAGLNLDKAEVHYATQVFGEAEAKLIRQKQIQERALTAYVQAQAKQLPISTATNETEGATSSAKTTAEDWVSRFWDDAGLVSDEVLQEIYARLLASEARTPGMCSLRTLSVLRYLDRQTAEDFARIAPLVFSSDWLPQDFELLKKFGASHAVITNLIEGLLLGDLTTHARTVPRDRVRFRYGSRVVEIAELPSGAQFRVVPLTTVGRELHRIAQFEPSNDYFFEAIAWMVAGHSRAKARWAQVPDSAWAGDLESLIWNAI
jgi:predicted nucleic acid-binding protein